MSSSDPNKVAPDSNTEPSPAGNNLQYAKPPSKPIIFGFLFLGLVVIAIAGAAWFQQLKKHRVAPPPPVISKISAPTFTDENGTSFSISQLDGRIWVVDFIFTRCGGQCPLMTTNMKRLQDWVTEKELGNVKLVSITVDPENDTPEVLNRYARTFKADPARWHFLTGDRKTIYDFILNDFKLETEENKGKPVADLFVHSDKFVLVDRERNIRGYYSGVEHPKTMDPDMKEIKDAILNISQRVAVPAPTENPE